MKLSVSKIKTNPFNERKTITQETLDGLEKLTKQMKKRGWWGSLLVRRKGNKYEAAFGSLRLKAARAAGVKNIEVEVEELSDKEMRELTVVENVHRQDVNPIDRATHLREYWSKYGKPTERELSKIFGIHQKTINDILSLSRLSGATQKLVKAGKIGQEKALKAHAIGGAALVTVVSKNKAWTRDEVRDMGEAVRKLPPKQQKKVVEQVVSGELEPWEVPMKTLKHQLPPKPKTIDAVAMARKLHRKLKEARDAVEVVGGQWRHFKGPEQLMLSMILGSLDKELHRTAEKINKEDDMGQAVNLKALKAGVKK